MADGEHGGLLGRNGTGPVPKDVGRAVTHMRLALAEPMTTADLARAAGVPARTLHRHFVAFLGAPPLAYLRQLRLTAAREALLAATNGVSVSEVAARVGYAHQGRFAVEYRRRFGEAPSATLARARVNGERAVPGVPRQRASLAILPFQTEIGRHEERAFAEKIYATLDAPSVPLDSHAEVQAFDFERPGLGSTDVGDVSWTVPTVGLRTATWVPGTPAHSWQATAAGGMSIGYKGMNVASQTLALAGQELFTRPDILAQAKAEFEKRRGPDFRYRALLGDRPPALDYRKGVPGGN